MNKMKFLIAALFMVTVPSLVAAQEVVVWRSPECGCCHLWAQSLQASGMQVSMTDVEDMTEVKKAYGVPDKLAGCRTAMVEGYTIEGHVPAKEIKRLLAERPDAIGLFVPDMPQGSPGMDSRMREPYQVLLL